MVLQAHWQKPCSRRRLKWKRGGAIYGFGSQSLHQGSVNQQRRLLGFNGILSLDSVKHLVFKTRYMATVLHDHNSLHCPATMPLGSAAPPRYQGGSCRSVETGSRDLADSWLWRRLSPRPAGTSSQLRSMCSDSVRGGRGPSNVLGHASRINPRLPLTLKVILVVVDL